MLAASTPAGAGPCTAAGDETGNIVALAQELAFPTWFGGGSGFLEPFATLYQSSLGYVGLGCSGSCPFSSDFGDVTCGDLVADPLSHSGVVELVGIPDPNAITALSADLLPDARWSLGAAGFISSSAGGSMAVTRTFADFEGGFRDVLDVSSQATTQQPISIDLYVGRGDLPGPVGCLGEILRTRPPHTIHFRVREDPVGPAPPVMLIDASSDFQTLQYGHNPFEVQVRPNGVLYLDVYQAAAVQAIGTSYASNPACNGGHATLDVRLDVTGTLQDGLQVFLSPAPTLSVISRGRLDYQTVPEPGIGASCAAGVLGLLALRTRARGCDRPAPR